MVSRWTDDSGRLWIVARRSDSVNLNTFRIARHPEVIDAGFDEVFTKKLNVKFKL